jgi:arylsulfatase A-like enzyme
MADDLGYGDVSCYGATAIQTPHIDRLAAGGCRFTSGYCSASTCTPTRFSLLTGTYAFRQKGTGIAPPNSPALIAPGTTTLPGLLKKAGYRTAVIGKWHLGLGQRPGPDWNGRLEPGPLEIGFDHGFLLPTTNDRVPQVFVEDHRVAGLDPSDPLWVADKPRDPSEPNGISHRHTLKMNWSHGHNATIHNGISRIGYYGGGMKARFRDEDLADHWVEKSIAWIQQNKQQPFFLFFASHDLHVPRIVHERFQGQSPLGPRGDAILELDWSVGQLVAAIQQAGLQQKTLFLFCSDNGPVLDDGYEDQAIERNADHRPSGPFRGGKYNVYEGGTRTPMIACWPGQIQPGVSDQMICTIDFPATLASLTGVMLAEKDCLDSMDLLPVLLGQSGARGRDHLLQQDNGLAGNFGFRVGPWKLHRHDSRKTNNVDLRLEKVDKNQIELYDLASDPRETKDLAATHPDKARELQQQLQQAIDQGRTRKPAAKPVSTKPVRPPNVVVFLSDDQGWGDLSLNGNTQLATPNIDSIAQRGAQFDRFFVCPVCSPTRAEFLTGRYHPRTGVHGVSTGQERLNLDERTLADAFLAAGYRTGAFGKWHNGSQWPYHPNARGFQEFYGFTSGHWGEYFDPPLENNGQSVRGQGFIADDLTSHAIEFIQRNRHEPFFCYVPYNTPHSPWSVPETDWLRFKDKPIHQLATDPKQENLDHTRCALAMCENLDWNVGRVLRTLQELSIEDDTIVVYFCDNGPNSWRWTGGMKGRKGSTDEGGIRSPLLVRWPGKIAPGTTVRPLAGAIDLMPTLLSMAGIPRVGGKPIDGWDLSPWLLSNASEDARVNWPKRTLFSTWGRAVSARTDRYRLDDRNALYDMVADPGQTRDIQQEQPQVAKELKEAVEAWRREMQIESGPNRGRQGVDPRPIHVGYPEFPRTPLPARDGTPLGSVQRSASAPNCSYFVRWSKPEDEMVWNLDVVRAGRYQVTVHHTCPADSVGSILEVQIGASRLQAMIAQAWDPPLLTNQDTLPRPPAESTMKRFKPWNLGEIHLERGTTTLRLKASKITGTTVMDVRQIDLILLDKE